MNRSKFCLYLKYVLILSFFALGVAIVYGSVYMRAVGFDKKIAQTLALKENSTSLHLWLNPPANIYRKFYMFNVTNPERVLSGKKPILQECGPYVYREVLEKRHLEYLDENRVKYTPVSTLYFEPELSNGTELDTINFISLLDLAVAEKSKAVTPKPFIFKSIHDLISGHKSALLDMVNLLTGKRREKFGLYSEKNATELFDYVAMTGSDNIKNIGKLESWKGMKMLNFWGNDHANAINGSDGSKYPPDINENQILSFFNPDLCRSLNLEFLNKSTVAGVKTYDFHLAKNIFSRNETLNPNYKGFCPKNDCLGDGLQSLRECREGAPIFASLPHFLNSEPKFLEDVVGLRPNESIHDFIVSIDPLTGTSVKSNLRVQFNYHLKKNKNVDAMKKIRDVLLPMFWLELSIDTYQTVKAKLIETRGKLEFLSSTVPILMLGVGSALVCASLVFLIFTILDLDDKKRRTSRKSDPSELVKLNN